MSITIEFSSPEEEAAFKAQVQAAGASAEEFARQALSQAALPSEKPRSLQDEFNPEE